MQPTDFTPLAMETLATEQPDSEAEWLWDGYMARGTITLLTSRWKLGKTTLLAGLLRHLSLGEPFLGRACVGASSVVASEESRQVWATRVRKIPVGPWAGLVSRPFFGRPTRDQWAEFVRRMEELRAASQLDLFVVDPLAAFLPGHSDSDPTALLDLLLPLRRLAEAGAAVLILHHPRKLQSEEGSTARGSGTLLGFVDVVLELHRGGPMKSEAHLRRLVALSRHDATPRKLLYEWTPGTAEFTVVSDPSAHQFQANWEVVRGILATRWEPATHRELMDDWPTDTEKPCNSLLYSWLQRATAEGLAYRSGNGVKRDPYRFGLVVKR